jgi:hypothetical protein
MNVYFQDGPFKPTMKFIIQSILENLIKYHHVDKINATKGSQAPQIEIK